MIVREEGWEGCIPEAIYEMIIEYEKFHSTVENTPSFSELFVDHQFFRQFHAACGLAGEGGEMLDLYKKQLFGLNEPVPREKILKELGDIFWYFTLMLRSTGITLNEVIDANRAKLSKRYTEGKR